MFDGRMSLSLVFLLLLVNFVSGFRLELMHISLIENIRSILTHLHGFQLLVHRNHFFHYFFFNCDSLHTTTTRHGLIRQRSTKTSQYIVNLFRKNLQLKKDKSSDSKVKFRQASNCCKRVLEVAKLAYADKTKESITSQKLGSWDFW